MKRNLIIIAIILVLAGGLYYISDRAKQTQAPAADVNQIVPQQPVQSSQPVPSRASSTQPDYTAPQAGGGENIGSNIQVTEVDFDGKQFTPAKVGIKAGDYIFFKNKSSVNFWPLAGSANTLAAYPNFNAQKPIAPGGEYKFQFTKAGSWSYGDNLTANAVGDVDVSQ